MGGMFGESKYEVLLKLPPAVVPKTVVVRQPTTLNDVLNLLQQERFSLPVIFKPDLGERGFMVKKIRNENDIVDYLARMKNDFLIQEMVDLPYEFGVFYRRFPDSEKGEVTSIVMKEMLYVVGDGISTLRDLILANDRAKLQWEKLRETYASRLMNVVAANEKLEIVSIGNHCLGTKFLNGNHLITPQLSHSFDCISKQIEGFYFGRYDLRCESLDDLAKGRILVMELNGCGAEPAHIYDPDFSLWRALLVLIEHWNSIFKIARQNKSRGFRFLPLREAVFHFRNFREKVNS